MNEQKPKRKRVVLKVALLNDDTNRPLPSPNAPVN